MKHKLVAILQVGRAPHERPAGRPYLIYVYIYIYIYLYIHIHTHTYIYIYIYNQYYYKRPLRHPSESNASSEIPFCQTPALATQSWQPREASRNRFTSMLCINPSVRFVTVNCEDVKVNCEDPGISLDLLNKHVEGSKGRVDERTVR